MDEPPAALFRLARFLYGDEPSQDVSRKQRWFSLVGGTAVVLIACLLLFPGGSEDSTRPFFAPTMVVLGLMSATQGGAGLLWEDRRGPSLWLWTLNGLLFVRGEEQPIGAWPWQSQLASNQKKERPARDTPDTPVFSFPLQEPENAERACDATTCALRIPA